MASSSEPGRALVFFDASVLVAAARSPTGGSAVVMEVCQGNRYRAAVTWLVLTEARVNVADKFGEVELLRFYNQLASLAPAIVSAPSAAQLAECVPLTTDKDAHVLAAALNCGADYLLTLDRRHLLNDRVLGAGLPLHPLTPGEFLQQIVSRS